MENFKRGQMEIQGGQPHTKYREANCRGGGRGESTPWNKPCHYAHKYLHFFSLPRCYEVLASHWTPQSPVSTLISILEQSAESSILLVLYMYMYIHAYWHIHVHAYKSAMCIPWSLSPSLPWVFSIHWWSSPLAVRTCIGTRDNNTHTCTQVK